MILEEIAGSARLRVQREKERISQSQMEELAERAPQPGSFEAALKSEGLSFICEVKKASPSKGVISKEFPYLQIAKDYEDAGAAAISVLTEPEYFLGSDHYLTEIGKTIKLPLLRKDFVVDRYQLYQAKVIGASAVLLICALLDKNTLCEYIKVCHSLYLSALVEAHTDREVDMALETGARIVGVNNRDLNTFKVDIDTCIRLRNRVPEDKIFVAESGIQTPEHIKMLEDAGIDAALVGEALMKSPDRKKALAYLRGESFG